LGILVRVMTGPLPHNLARTSVITYRTLMPSNQAAGGPKIISTRLAVAYAALLMQVR
jgi:hypothetical protein